MNKIPYLLSMCEAFYFPAEGSTCGMGNMLRLVSEMLLKGQVDVSW